MGQVNEIRHHVCVSFRRIGLPLLLYDPLDRAIALVSDSFRQEHKNRPDSRVLGGGLSGASASLFVVDAPTCISCEAVASNR